MPQAEKLKLKAESKMVEKEEASSMLADHKILVRQIHEAYMKNFSMNKAKARLILTGKTSKPVKRKKVKEWSLNIFKIYIVSSPTNTLSSVFSQQPFIIHDMETFQLAERTLAVHMLNSGYPEPESSPQAGELVPAVGGSTELQQREAEARLFHCCQSTSVETVTELTEFAKAVPGFQSLDLNDQVWLRIRVCLLPPCENDSISVDMWCKNQQQNTKLSHFLVFFSCAFRWLSWSMAFMKPSSPSWPPAWTKMAFWWPVVEASSLENSWRASDGPLATWWSPNSSLQHASTLWS